MQMNASVRLGRTEESLGKQKNAWGTEKIPILLYYLECCDVLFVPKICSFLYVQS